MKIVQAQRRWTTVDGEPTAEPMEVDALGKGKSGKKGGKGKDKGSKGKDKCGDKGKGKSKEKGGQHGKGEEVNETRTCHYCQKTGHLAAACKKKPETRAEIRRPRRRSHKAPLPHRNHHQEPWKQRSPTPPRSLRRLRPCWRIRPWSPGGVPRADQFSRSHPSRSPGTTGRTRMRS